MNCNTRTWISVTACALLAGCEQKDDQSLLKVYEVFQRDMQKRDEQTAGSLKQIQEEMASLHASLGDLQKKLPAAGAVGESGGKLAAEVSESVGRKLAEQNAAGLAEMKAQITQLQEAVAKIAAAPPPQTAAAPAQPPAAPAPAKTADGLRYRDQPPAEPQPAGSTKSSDPSRKKYRIEF